MAYSIDDLEQLFYKADYPPLGLASDGKVIARRNLCANPNFETNTTGWGDLVAGQTTSRDTVTFHSGVAAMKVVRAAASGTLGKAHNPTPYPAVSPGQVITLSAWIYSTIASTWTPAFSWRDAGRLEVSNQNVAGIAVSANTWTRVIGTFTVPANASIVGAEAWLQSTTYATTDAVYIDDVLIEKSSTVGTYFDGSTTDDNWTDYRWEGTANASTSIAAEPEPITYRNICSNPSLEANHNQWFVNQGSGGTTNTTWPTDGGYSGITYQRSTWTVASTGSSGNYFHTETGTVFPGDVISAGVYVRTNVTKTMFLRIGWQKRDDTSFSVSDSVTVSVSPNQWTRLTLTNQTAPALTDSIFVAAYTVNASIGHVIDTDAMVIVKSNVLPDTHFDQVIIDTKWRDRGYLEKAYWAKRSSLTPAEQYSVADHQRAALLAAYSPVAGDLAYVSARNLCTNPSFEVNLNDWLPYIGGTRTRVTTDFDTGIACQQIVTTATFQGTLFITNAYYPAGTTFYVSAKVKGTASNKASFGSRSTSVSGSNTENVNQVTFTGAWQNVTDSHTLTTDSQIGLQFIVSGADTASQTMFIDSVVVSTSPINSYFDGATAAGSGKFYRWQGTANASVSEQIDPSRSSGADLQISKYMAGSGLTPAAQYSALDHEMAYYKAQLGVS